MDMAALSQINMKAVYLLVVVCSCCPTTVFGSASSIKEWYSQSITNDDSRKVLKSNVRGKPHQWRSLHEKVVRLPTQQVSVVASANSPTTTAGHSPHGDEHGHKMSLPTLVINIVADLCPHGMLPLAYGIAQGGPTGTRLLITKLYQLP